MEAVRISATSVYSNETTRRYIPESSNLHTRHRENLKSHNPEDLQHRLHRRRQNLKSRASPNWSKCKFPSFLHGGEWFKTKIEVISPQTIQEPKELAIRFYCIKKENEIWLEWVRDWIIQPENENHADDNKKDVTDKLKFGSCYYKSFSNFSKDSKSSAARKI
jgi:hypothetical protein